MKQVPIYEPEFIEKVISNLSIYRALEIDTNNVLTFNKKETIAFNKIINQYQKIELYNDAHDSNLNYLDPEMIIKLSNYFLSLILPKFTDEILAYDSILDFQEENLEDVGLNYRVVNKNVELGYISLEDNYNEYSISIIAHEKVHALCFNHLDTVELFNEGLELFPIFIQKLVIYEMMKYTDSLVSTYSEIIRSNDCRRCVHFLKLSHYLHNNEDKTPIDELVSEYFRIKSTDYLKADIYSNLLMTYYIQDRNTMIEKLEKLFCRKITIPEFLDYYNISIDRKENIPLLKENLSKTKRIIFTP